MVARPNCYQLWEAWWVADGSGSDGVGRQEGAEP